MTIDIEAVTEDRIAAFVAAFRRLPDAARQLLEAQAMVFCEQEIRHSENVARLREQNEVLIAANAAVGEENAKLRHEIETRGAKNAGLRQEIVALTVENAALREERTAIELLDKAVEQYRAGRGAAQAGMRACKPEITADAADLPSAGADRAAEPLDGSDGEPDAAQPAISPSESVGAEPTAPPETEAVFRLPSVLLARVDEAIATGRWSSRDAFARTAFAEAIERHNPGSGGHGKDTRRAAGKKRDESAGRSAPVSG